MKRRILTAALLGLLLPLLAYSDSDPQAPPTKPEKAVVSLTVDYGDGAQKRYPRIPWKRQMTALDATQWAAKHPRGIKVKQRGSGQITLVTQIDDLKNGGGSQTKNWIFRVNGKLGDKSCAVFHVQPGDRILWSFEHYK